MVTGNGDEPLEWVMDDDMWKAVRAAAEARECIDAGDPLPIEGDMILLGTPVTIHTGSVPFLRYRKADDGKVYGAPVLGNMTEQPPRTPSHSISSNG
jgi:hypothetical protein